MDEAHVNNYSSWLESMGSLINNGEESRILLGREVSFGWNYQVVPESSSNVHENKFYTLFHLLKQMNYQQICKAFAYLR